MQCAQTKSSSCRSSGSTTSSSDGPSSPATAVNHAVAASGFQAPGTDNLLVSIRKAMSTIMSSGYRPDTLILTPAAAEPST